MLYAIVMGQIIKNCRNATTCQKINNVGIAQNYKITDALGYMVITFVLAKTSFNINWLAQEVHEWKDLSELAPAVNCLLSELVLSQ